MTAPDTGTRSRTLHPTQPTPRIEPLPVASMRPEWLATLARIPGAGLKGDGFPRHVLGMLIHSPETVGSFLEYWVTGKERMALSVREQELVILRMACLFGSNYVWQHHVPVGREFGIVDDELEAVRTARFDHFGPREQALLALTDELMEERTISAGAWATHATRLTTVDLVDLIGLVSQYVLFALMNNAMQVQLEATLGPVPALDEALGDAADHRPAATDAP
jgi:4-carboxymuconolactone decarboxylase